MVQLDNLSIAYLLKELRPALEGAYVNKVSEITKGKLKLKLHTKTGSKDLIITPHAIFTTKYSVPARHGKTNFAVALWKQLYNKRIVGIEQNGLDRVVVIKFLEHSLVLEFIGDGNKILLSKNNIILSCERNEKWADRETRKGLPYRFPKQHGLDPSGLTMHQLHSALESSGKDIVRGLIATVNVSPLAAEETAFRSGLAKSTPASSLNNTQMKKLLEQLEHFYGLKEKPAPVAYREFAYPFPLLHIQNQSPVNIQSMTSFLDEEFSKAARQPQKSHRQVYGTNKKDRQASHKFMQAQQQAARHRFEAQAQETRRKGELIYSHYTEIEELRKAVLSAIGKGIGEKVIMQKISAEAGRGNRVAKLLRRVDVKAGKIEVELE